MYSDTETDLALYLGHRIVADADKLRSEYEEHIEKEYPNTAKAKATRTCLEYVCGPRADFGDEK